MKKYTDEEALKLMREGATLPKPEFGAVPPADKTMIYLWLDDVRPAPGGWYHVKTIQEAMPFLERGEVEMASLDHDLGACSDCMDGLSLEKWLILHNYKSMPNCPHFGTGYDLVCWMEETGHWPVQRPFVHSRNPAGAAKMRQAINRKFDIKEAD